MRKILVFLFVLITCASYSQVYHGFNSYTVDASIQMLVKFPSDTSGGKKFPVIFSMCGNGEVGTDPNVLFNVGLGRQFINFPSLMPDSIIYVMVLPASNQAALEQPVNQINCFDKLTSITGRTDTTNWLLCGLSQGAVNAISAPTWPVGIGFGNGGDYRYNRFKKFMEVSMCGVRANAVFSRLANKRVHMMHGTADGTCAVGFTNATADSITAYGGFVTKILITGGGHDNGVWDSAYSPKGVDSSHNIYLWAMSKGAFVPATNNYQARVYDVFEGLYGGYDPNKPENYFDSQKGNKFNVDPKNGVTADTTSASNPAHGWNTTIGTPAKANDIYGFGRNNKGVLYYMPDSLSRCRVIVDLIGTRNVLDLSKKFVFTDIYGLDAEEANHNLYFYKMDSAFGAADYNRRAALLSRYDSLLTPMAIVATTGDNGWTHVSFSDSCRWVMIVASANLTTFHESKFKELVFYGHYNFDTTASSYKDSIRTRYAGKLPTHKNSYHTYGKVIGENWFNGMGPQSRKYIGPARLYTQQNYADTALSATLPTTFKYYPAGFNDFNNTIIATIKSEGHDLWVTNQAARQYNANATTIINTYGTHADTTNGISVNLDSIGVEPEKATNWKADSILMTNLAKVWGRTTGGSNQFSIHPANGQNLFTTMELGNERSHHGYSTLADYFDMRGMYRGIKAVDATMEVIQGGMVELDTRKIKTLWLYSQALDPAKKFPADGVNGHKYLNNADSLLGFSTLDQQVGTHQDAPEWAINSKTGHIRYIDSVHRDIFTYLDTTYSTNYTEYGRGQDSVVSSNTSEASYFDYFCTVGTSRYSALRMKAILNFRQNVFILNSPIKRANMYSNVNGTSGTQQNSTLFLSFGKGSDRSSSDFEIKTFFDDWYYSACTYTRLKNYYYDSTITNGGRAGQWVIQMRSAVNSDSVCRISYLGSYSGAFASATIPVNTASQVEEYQPAFTNTIGTSTSLTPSSGTLSRSIDENPKLYFYSESAVTPPSCTTLNAPTVTSNSAILSWNAASGAVTYDVYFNGSLVANVSTLTYTMMSLTPSTTYSWNIFPRNSGGAATGCTPGSFITSAATPGSSTYSNFFIRIH